MYNILITGNNSYVGKKFERWIKINEKRINIDFISLKNSDWEKKDFSTYDVLIHLAAIVHKKESKIPYEEYYRVNVDLSKKLITKCKNEGVNQFIFFSSMSVYGLEASMKKVISITKNTTESPNTKYGKTKLDAEREIIKIADNFLPICILRPPMIYGDDCPGNYKKMKVISRVIPFIPYIENKKSVIHIDNLCEFLYEVISKKSSGIYLPQDSKYMNTSNEFALIRKKNNLFTYKSNFLGSITLMFFSRNSTFKKIFGNLIYEDEKVEEI